ncbi:MAG: UPF0280 family protein [Candidatus Omnitrophica bacterium]|nr:UPF0280 family protein [Candidatus Omnitrophota bacterium]
MKSPRFKHRFYRDWSGAKDLFSSRIVERETDLRIFTDKPLDKDFLQKRIQKYRFDIEGYIDRDRRFLSSLKPIVVELTAPGIVRKMAKEANNANVGPMAAVAGAIAHFLGKDLLRRGYKEVIIENGGDIFLASRKTRFVGIYSGKSRLWQDLKIKVPVRISPLGICTSSGTIGHSLSFGCAESAVILAKDAVLADAVATATCNRVQKKEDLPDAVNFARHIRGVLGACVIFKNNLTSWGKIELLK